MASFRYQALGKDGRMQAGVLDAPSRTQALDVLLARGETPVDLQPAADGFAFREWLKPQAREFSVKDAAAFSSDVARLLGSGFSLHQALQMCAVSTGSKRAQALAETSALAVQKGENLHSVLTRESSGPAQSLAGLVQAGEKAGRLQAVLEDAAKSFGASARFREKLGSALIYPLIILFMITLTLLLFFAFVLPRLQPLFDEAGDKLPMATKILLGIGEAASRWGPWILIGVLGLLILMQVRPALKTSLKRFVDKRLLGRLGMGAARTAGYAAYARTLGMLISSGVPLAGANATAAGAVSNLFLRTQFEGFSARLRGGEKLSSLLEQGKAVPEILPRMVFIGERSGKLGPALQDAAGILERSAETRTERLLAILTPAVTIVLGILVAFVVGSLFMGLTALTEVDL